MTGSKTRLKRFIYIVCFQQGSELLCFFKNILRGMGDSIQADSLLYFPGQGLFFSREALLLPLLVSLVHIRWIERRLLCSSKEGQAQEAALSVV